MCEHSSVNPAAALREARRRKILENSANRLKLIEGITSFSQKTETQTETFRESKPNSEVHKCNNIDIEKSGSEISSKFTDFVKTNKELKEISDFLSQDRSQEHDEVEEEEVVEANTVEQEHCNVFFKVILQKRLHYVFLAFTVNILFFFNAGKFFYENIFCPFYTVKTIELITKKGEKEDFQPVLFLFVAGLPKSVQKITRIILPVVTALFSDLCVYLFTFIIGTRIMNNQN